jgi:ATP-binding protein involved in chromosome partitioning
LTLPLPTAEQLTAALSTVEDPEIRRPVTELGMVKSAEVGPDGVARIAIFLTVSGCPMKDTITERVTAAVGALAGVTRVEVELDVMSADQRKALQTQLRGDSPEREIPFARPGSLTRVFAVASGKGGVGKSSVTVNLAAQMAQRGLQVGVLDADIYGFSVPRMLGVQHRPTQVESMILPPSAHGVKVISIGMFTKDNTPVVWRGPMLHRALQQFLADVFWGDLDVLLMDLPPGTGRRRHLRGAARAERRDPGGDDAAAGRAGGRRAGRRHRAADPPAHRRRGREHELAAVPALRRAHRRLRLGRRARRWPARCRPGWAPRCRCSARSRSTCACARAATAAGPLVLDDPDAVASKELAKVTDALVGRPRGLAGVSLGLSPARR